MILPDEADILIVQDDPLEVELLLRPLRELSSAWQVAVARDGEEALDYLLGRGAFRHRLGAALPRLVLLEFKLPKVDGIDVIRALRASHRTGAVPVVILLPAGEPREVGQCYQAGANSCVRTPVDLAEFREVIQGVARYWLGVNEAPPSTGGTAAVVGRTDAS